MTKNIFFSVSCILGELGAVGGEGLAVWGGGGGVGRGAKVEEGGRWGRGWGGEGEGGAGFTQPWTI